jgi:hypothetical protein
MAFKKPWWFKPGLINAAQTICKPTRKVAQYMQHRPDGLRTLYYARRRTEMFGMPMRRTAAPWVEQADAYLASRQIPSKARRHAFLA